MLTITSDNTRPSFDPWGTPTYFTPFFVHLYKMYIYLRQQLKLYGKYMFISIFMHSMTINGILERYNNTICMEMHNQLHLCTNIYSKWSIVNTNWQTLVFFRINNWKKKYSLVSFIIVTCILKYWTKIQEYVHYHLNFMFIFSQHFAEADIKWRTFYMCSSL